MPRAHARRVHFQPAPRESLRNPATRMPAPASLTGDGSPAQIIPFPFRFRPAAGRSNPSPLLSEFAGSLPGSMDARPRSAEIHTASNILPAAGDFPAITPAAVLLVAQAVSSAPGPPAFAENRTRHPSSPRQLLPPIHTPSAAAPVLSHPPACSRAKRPAPKPPASSSP